MDEYIKREAVLRAVHGQRSPCRSPAQNRMLDCLKAAVIRISAADVAPVVHARWIYEKETLATSSGYCCSACRQPRWISPDVPEAFKYYPKCGAKMDGERKDGGDG